MSFSISLFSVSFLSSTRLSLAPNHSYMFLTNAMNLQLRGALDIFYTGNELCLPGGPNFDRRFYLAWSTMLGSIAGAAGVSLLYACVFSKHSGWWDWKRKIVGLAHALTMVS